MSREPWKAKCSKCGTVFPKPPPFWDCPSCKVKTWQPDETADKCTIPDCGNTVAKFSRHHCRACGFVTCASCTTGMILIPEWSTTDKQRVCKLCSAPKDPCSMSGYLEKLGQRHALFGEKFQKRFFELHGTILRYYKDKGAPLTGQIDLEEARVIDVAIHQNAFCLMGPKLPRGYVLSAENADDKRAWVDALNKELSKSGKEEDERTESILYAGHSTGEISMSSFDLLTVLGLGSFGRVMKVREKATGQIFAMKVLDKAQIIANKMITHTQAERAILSEIKHPFVCKLHYAFQTRKHLVLILDFLCGGELFFHLQRSKRFSESRAKFYAAEIGLALEYIHTHNIIYRDLKPENLVLDREGHVNLTDFGLAKKDVKDVTHTFCGTPEYMAPELIQKRGHTKAVDWWSLGVFIYEMVAGLPPFYTQNIAEMYDAILNRPLAFPSYFSEGLKNLLRKLLEKDPSKRMQSGDEFKRAQWFADVNWDDLYNRRIRPEFVPDVTSNDLRYFDKQFTQETVNVPMLDMPYDPNDPVSRRFEGFDYSPVFSPTQEAGNPLHGSPGSDGHSSALVDL